VNLEEAKEITGLCLNHGLFNMGVDDNQPKPITDYSLDQLLEANKIVAEHPGDKNPDGTTSYMMHCAPRMIAALYVAYNFPAQEIPEDDDDDPLEPIASGPNGTKVLIVRTRD